MSDDIKRMPTEEFRERGYLHEVNRLVLHPLGLALEVQVFEDRTHLLALADRSMDALRRLAAVAREEGLLPATVMDTLDELLDGREVQEAGSARLGGVWDCQDDPEGMLYGDDLLSAEKAIAVCEELLSRRDARKEHTGGWVVQPIPDEQVLTVNYVDPSAQPPSVFPELN